jgi:hypothetical protein
VLGTVHSLGLNSACNAQKYVSLHFVAEVYNTDC